MQTVDYHKQAEDFLKETNTVLKVKYLKYDKHFQDDKEMRNIYRITLKRGKKSYSFNFGQSINDTKEGIQPNSYDVLTCLTKHNPYNFHEFCMEYGYDEDSIKALRIFKAIVKEWEAVKRVFDIEGEGEGHYNTILKKLRDIQ